MAQIQGGTSYANGSQVTATNLNAHVNNAVLIPGAISDQTAASSTSTADSILILQSGSLKRATLAQLQTGISPDLSAYLPRNGSAAMTGELTLSSSSPSGSLSAASKGYVDTGLSAKQASLGFTPINKAGDTAVGSLAMSGTLTLAADPASSMQAATKQYADTKQAALGFTPVNKAGDTMTGALTLAADPSSNLQASTKQYVDNQVATRIPAGGASVSGNYLFSGSLQTSATPTVDQDVATKSYVDAISSSIPKFLASAYFYTSTAGNSTVNTVTFLNVSATRSAGSSTLTINYGALASRYYDSTKPFFIQEQYIGINSVTGITARLYKITSANLAARTFTVSTPETTAFSGTIQLTLVYDSTSLASNQYGQNVKSIYIDMSCVSKMYVNYITDAISGSSAPVSPANNPVRCVQLSGNANGYDLNTLMALPMRDVGRTANIYSQDVPEGFGSNSLGCHIGWFYNNSNGSDHSGYYAASFLITAILPPS